MISAFRKLITLKVKHTTLLLAAFIICQFNYGQPLTNYMAFTGWGRLKHHTGEVILLRKFDQGKHSFYFVVSPQSLNTSVVHADSLEVVAVSWPAIYSRYWSSPYISALRQAATNSKALQDAGLTQFSRSQKGIDLTIDLCPSQRPLDRIVFKDLMKEFARVEKPVPLSISITGRWINEHPKDLQWLDSLVKAGDLSILWINHTYNHLVEKDVPLTRNFILAPGTDINSEVLKTEIALIERGIIPSVFFRFPGLVSDEAVFEKIQNLGLIPVGSDAWLAKGQWPTSGSIVLIHANGNEPMGVQDFIKLLKNELTAVLAKKWELFDLRESVVDDKTNK